jgi:hypothetical protein
VSLIPFCTFFNLKELFFELEHSLAMLYQRFREELEEEPTNECEPLSDLGLQVTPRHPQQEDTKAAGMDVKDVAFVRFVPSSKNPHPDFADELYFPPIDEESPQQPPAASDFAISNGALLFELQKYNFLTLNFRRPGLSF